MLNLCEKDGEVAECIKQHVPAGGPPPSPGPMYPAEEGRGRGRIRGEGVCSANFAPV